MLPAFFCSKLRWPKSTISFLSTQNRSFLTQTFYVSTQICPLFPPKSFLSPPKMFLVSYTYTGVLDLTTQNIGDDETTTMGVPTENIEGTDNIFHLGDESGGRQEKGVYLWATVLPPISPPPPPPRPPTRPDWSTGETKGKFKIKTIVVMQCKLPVKKLPLSSKPINPAPTYHQVVFIITFFGYLSLISNCYVLCLFYVAPR